MDKSTEDLRIHATSFFKIVFKDRISLLLERTSLMSSFESNCFNLDVCSGFS